MYAEMMRQLWDQIKLTLSPEENIEAIWIPSHSGIQKNDVADELARRGIRESNLLTQQEIPLTMEAARSIIKPTVQSNIVSVPTLPDEIKFIEKDGRRLFCISS